MKMIIVALAFVAIVAAAPSSPLAPETYIKIIRSEFDQQPEGAYVFGFETDNGILRQEQGDLKEVLDEENKPHSVVVVRGSYTYPDEDGKPLTITYTADENGYRAEGESIPKVPVPSRR